MNKISQNKSPFWKKVYHTVSGYSINVTETAVAEVLKEHKTELIQGLFRYQKFTKQKYDDWCAKNDVNFEMREFIHDLSLDLNLDPFITYGVACNYLMFEFYGKVNEFWQLTRIGTTVPLRDNIWHFFTSERMFLLKTLKHVFEFVDKEHDFSEPYHCFLKGITMTELHEMLLKQFEDLISELATRTFETRHEHIESFLCRNIREQIEIVSILLLVIKRQALNDVHMAKLVELFVHNNFGTSAPLFEYKDLCRKRDMDELMFVEIGCFFVILENYWEKDLGNFWNSSITKKYESLILTLHLSPGHTLVLFTWLVLRFKSLNDNADGKKIMELLQNEPFVLLNTMLADEIFKNSYFGDSVIKAAHKMMDQLCLMIKDRVFLYERKDVIHVLAAFLKQPELVETCLADRNGLDEFMKIGVETFPRDFMSFSLISEALLQHPTQYKTILDLLNNLPSFLSDTTWSRQRQQISILKKSQPAFPDSDLIIFPVNTMVRSYRIFGNNFLQYTSTNYSYFRYLEYLVNLLINMVINSRSFDEDLVKKVIAGYHVVIAAIKFSVDMDPKLIGLHRVVLKLNKLIIHLDGALIRHDLTEVYFKVLNTMVENKNSTFFDICTEIVYKNFFPKIRPDHLSLPIEQFLFNQYVFEQTVFMKLFHDEEFKEDHSFLLTYLDLLQNVLDVRVMHKDFQLSGLSYVYNFIFLQHQGWTYQKETQKVQITLACLNLFHSTIKREMCCLDETELKLFLLTQHAFLNNAYIIECLLRLFVKEKSHFIYIMERETNWSNGPANHQFQCMKIQMSLLLQIMYQMKHSKSCIFYERLCHVVKPVTSYFTNSYNSEVSVLACRFLEKIAEDENIPLLALLEFDHYQVQTLFLERLKHLIEPDKIKIAIIDLINTCIANQSGMTAAFFNLKCFMYWDGTDRSQFKGDSVTDFMVEYLQNIKKTNCENPLQISILRLLVNLWLNHRDSLIENLSNLAEFWPIIAEPLIRSYKHVDLEVYSVTLRILVGEMMINSNKLDENFVKTIHEFFQNKPQLRKWLQFILKETVGVGDKCLELLNAWSEFIMMMKKSLKEVFTDDIKIIILNSCLDGLNAKEAGFNNVDLVYLWGQLFFILTSEWQISKSQHKSLIVKFTKFLQSLTAYYKYLDPKIKEIVLCCINRVIIDLEEYFIDNSTSLTTLVYSLGMVIDAEHEYLERSVFQNPESEKALHIKPWLVILSIGNTLICSDFVDDLEIWFKYRYFLDRVMKSVGPMLRNRSTLPFAKLAIDFLITYAESSLAHHFISVDLFSFYFNLKPPSMTISFTDALTSGVPVQLKEWWLLFITIMKLNRVLLENLEHRIASIVFTFVMQYDQFLKDVVSLIKHTVDMTALILVGETMKFIYLLLQLMPDWERDAQQSHRLMMEGVMSALNACVLSILGYKKINFYETVGKGLLLIENPPQELLLSVLNKVTEITFWACTCLRKTKSCVLRNLDTAEIEQEVTLLVENDFSMPRFEPPITPKLTYGTLFCLADYLCKALTQLSPHTQMMTPRSRLISLSDIRDEIRGKNLGQIFEHCVATYENFIGFMVYLSKTDDMTNEKLSSFLHYDMSEFSGTTSSVVAQMDYQLVKNSLDALMTFLAYEIFYTLKSLNPEHIFAYKRELSSEIQFFYEFVRKRTGDHLNAMGAVPRSSQSETDIITRYVTRKYKDRTLYDIADNNFAVVISQFLNKYCHLSN